MENTQNEINEKAIKYYNTLKRCQKNYAQSEEGKLKLRNAIKRYYD